MHKPQKIISILLCVLLCNGVLAQNEERFSEDSIETFS